MNRADRFDRADFEARARERETTPMPSSALQSPADTSLPAPSGKTPTKVRRTLWPITRNQLRRVGESVLADRNGKGRPHKGIDLFADAGTEVRAACRGHVLRVVDGRKSPVISQRRAGLFIDVRGDDSLIYRYMHLGEARVAPETAVEQGAVLGTVAAAFTSGLAETPHLHFEIRQGDFDRSQQDYGLPVDPLRLLPPLRV